MTRQTSKGTCTFCHGEFSKASMTRHLESCEQRVAIQAEAGSHQKAQKTGAFHLVVEGYRLPMYWMHLEVSAGTTLVPLDQVLHPGQTCSYEYDFGSTTELTLKVISEREVPAKKKAIEILARNNLPTVPCDVCGKPATNTCTQCIYEDKGWLCDACAKDHECGEEMLWPMVNSPRAGVCGYTGQDPAYIW